MIRLLHAADLHLGSPFKGLTGRFDPLPARLANATCEAFTRVVDLALLQQVDGVLLAGDLFDAKDRLLSARLHLKNQLERLHEANVPSFVVHGNHDPLSADPGGLSLPASVHVFGPRVDEVRAVSRSGQPFRVIGYSFPQTEVTQRIALQYVRSSDEPTVGLLHANLQTHSSHRDYAPCTLEELARARLDYWALGHVHTRATHLLDVGVAAYPGNTQGRHVKETGPRGCLLVTIDPSRQQPAQTQFFACDAVRWHRLKVNANDVEQLDAVEQRLLLAVQQAVAEHGDVAAHAVQLELTAHPSVGAQLSGEGQAAFEAQLSARLLTLGDVYLCALHIQVQAGWELERVIASGGLAAEVALGLRQPAPKAELERLFADEALAKVDQLLASVGLSTLKDDAAALHAAAAREAVERLLEELP